MDIKVGEYIRTRNGDIGKLEQIVKGVADEYDYILTNTLLNYCGFLEEIEKHSFNIIDLIEVGDIVNLEYYVRKYGKRIIRKFEIENLSDEVIYFDNRHCSFCYDLKQNIWRDGKGYNPKIKTIVTKEQFKAVGYEV